MAFILNEYEVAEALVVAEQSSDEFPNFKRAAVTLANLVQWTRTNSDGWPYWAKPLQASKNLQALVKVQVNEARYGVGFGGVDLTDAELTAALSPVKAFLTRQHVDHSEVIAPTVEEVAREQVQAELRQAWAEQEAEELRFEVEAGRIAHLFPSWTVQQVNSYAVRSLEYEDALAELG